jgi:hypothetical protein
VVCAVALFDDVEFCECTFGSFVGCSITILQLLDNVYYTLCAVRAVFVRKNVAFDKILGFLYYTSVFPAGIVSVAAARADHDCPSAGYMRVVLVAVSHSSRSGVPGRVGQILSALVQSHAGRRVLDQLRIYPI